MSDMMILGGRRRGRPPAATSKSHLTVYVSNSLQDRLATLALKHGISVSQALERVVEQSLQTPSVRISVQNKSPD